MDKKILIKNARAIVSCDGEDRVYRDADMLIEGPRILAIGRDLMNQRDPVSGREWKQEEVQVIQAEGKFVYPGLINTHHHFFQTFVRNLITIDYPNMMVMDWIDKIYRIFQNIDSDVIYYSTLTSFADLIKHGCTPPLTTNTATPGRPASRRWTARWRPQSFWASGTMPEGGPTPFQEVREAPFPTICWRQRMSS